MEREILTVVIVSMSVLVMLALAMLLDVIHEVRHQRQAQQAFWDWVWYTRRRREV